jgi:hypothetical protein
LSIELEACYERIEELKQMLRLVREVITSDDYDGDRDNALGAIDEALDENVVCPLSSRSSFLSSVDQNGSPPSEYDQDCSKLLINGRNRMACRDLTHSEL